ncbi:formin-like protein [Artemia franciscana]
MGNVLSSDNVNSDKNSGKEVSSDLDIKTQDLDNGGMAFLRNKTVTRSQKLRKTLSPPPPKRPMPEQGEVERRFTQVLMSMDLPPDKVKVLRQYDDEKKWDMICDQELVQARDAPAYYIKKLVTYMAPMSNNRSSIRRILNGSTSTQVLRDLEISLRTNSIGWVREFLNDENKGLEILVDYLSFRLLMMK